ncbi:MAG: dihydroneopterin aldolase [Ignavibacteria bacterium]|nr:dihydroneopterin aldolase [Ignavibacteria bacterium]
MVKNLQPMKLTVKMLNLWLSWRKNEERTLGGKYQIDLELYYNARSAVINDDVSDSVNYEEAMYAVDEIFNAEEPYNLIETLCYDILTTIMERFPLVVEGYGACTQTPYSIGQVIGYVEAEQTISREG